MTLLGVFGVMFQWYCQNLEQRQLQRPTPLK